ncbi:hypothetical protein LX97_00137 [Nonlabens dokdonensis]|jgi:hypothetical protein|uniref:Uncharacterized protein n=2 Tax=Nonlabens dokdonensis TaxID=328515 RepID=L7W6M9_NONDD|nr:hypothetical protein [Nonlabens dokdonensis]AGC75441.1 hypothetical protein DDD_0314 [Nonlabens dokdonensis DSW-6]PZX43138.1 hypothetical protein LX97_00137 [Nonlabens dokdonensis]
MTNDKYLEDIKEIKSLMNKSTRFISLSGMSGIMAGVYALIGSVIGHFIIQNAYEKGYRDTVNTLFETPWAQNPSLQIVAVATGVMFMAVITAFFLTRSKAKKYKQKVWTKQSLRLIANFMAPLSIGAVFTLVLLQYNLLGLVAPAMLVFYGLACMNAAQFTLGTVKYLGLSCAILGLINTQFIGYGLYFWAAGFGLCHIIYGAVMYYKYDR